MQSAEVLFTPDTLLLIINHLDIPSLLSLRLTSSRLDQIIVAHQRLICTSITSQRHDDGGLHLPAYNGPFTPRNLHLKALARFDKARFLVWNLFLSTYNEPVSPLNGMMPSRITRGILIMWTLVDIQQEVSPSHAISKYSPSRQVPSRLAPLSRLRQKVVKKLLRRSALQVADTPSTSISDPEPASLSDRANKHSSPSDSLDATKRLNMIRQAQQPFVTALNREARVGLQLAREYLAEFLPTYLDHADQIKYWWMEDWALRQGPQFILAFLSRDENERAWASERAQEEWRARPTGERDPVGHSYAFCFPDSVGSENQLQTISAEAWQIKSDLAYALQSATDGGHRALRSLE